MIKKLTSILLLIIILISITGCSQSDTSTEVETTTQYTQETTTAFIEATTTAVPVELTTEPDTQELTITPVKIQLSNTQLIEIYKSAAQKTAPNVKSEQKISMLDFSVDNGGAINSIMKMFLPVISKVVESNSTEFDGITGGYQNLTEEDIAVISYSSNNDTIEISITLKEQTDNGTSEINNGTVGHAISVIGDLSSVFNQLKDSGIPISVSNDDIVMTYKNPKVVVTIDNDGNITEGSWSYDVTLDLNNFTVGGTVVPKASVVIRNEITI